MDFKKDRDIKKDWDFKKDRDETIKRSFCKPQFTSSQCSADSS